MKREVKNMNSILKKWILPLLILVFSPNMYSQNITVKGTVTDNTQDPLIGVTVQVQGTGAGTITDMDGNFELPNVPSNDVLEIS